MTTINPYPTKVAARYKLTDADLRVKNQSLFLIVEREHNYYDDSDTNFLYYDAENDCLKTGQWTTRGYCGDLFYDYPMLYTADESVKTRAFIAMRKYAKSMVTPQSFTEGWWQNLDIEKYGIPCVVDGGRKYRGEGILVKMYRHESYYGNSLSVSIWTGEKIEYANPRFVKVDAQLVMDKLYELIDKMSFQELYEFVKEIFDNNYEKPTITALKMICPIIDVEEPTYKSKEHSLREWVAKKFSDKSELEQERITHHIMAKKYGSYYR